MNKRTLIMYISLNSFIARIAYNSKYGLIMDFNQDHKFHFKIKQLLGDE